MPDRVIALLPPQPRLWLGSIEFSAFEPRNGRMQRYTQHRAALAFGYAGDYVSGTLHARQAQPCSATWARSKACAKHS